MRYIEIIRTKYLDKQTLGYGYIKSDCNIIYEFKTLELPWLNNQRNISCIPLGTYPLEKIISPSLGKCIDVKCVPNRTYIRIHAGNFYTDIKGCILVGQKHIDINSDGYKDVTNSRITLNHILKLIDNNETFLVIKNG